MATLSNIIPALSISQFASAGTDYVSPSGTETLTNKTLITANVWNSTAVTAANGTSNTMIATTAFVLNNIPVQQASGISTGKAIAMAMIFGF